MVDKTQPKESLIFGGTSRIGKELVHLLPNAIAVTSSLCDLGNKAQREEFCRQHKLVKNLVFLQRYRGDGDKWVGEMEISLTATNDIINAISARCIVLCGSIAGTRVCPEQPVGYHVAKAGLAQMARYYAATLPGVRVNCVSPGDIKRSDSRKPIAQVIAFLCSEEAGAINGQEIVVDNGASLF